MTAPKEFHIQKHLNPIRDTLVSAIHLAFRDWRENIASKCNWSKRGRANFLWEQIIWHASNELASIKNVRLIHENETVKFLVDDTVLFRFKKMDEEGVSRNAPTQLALAFHDHTQILPGFPEIHRVDVGYILNELETAVADVLVVCRDGDDVKWSYSLLESEGNLEPIAALERDSEPRRQRPQPNVKVRNESVSDIKPKRH